MNITKETALNLINQMPSRNKVSTIFEAGWRDGFERGRRAMCSFLEDYAGDDVPVEELLKAANASDDNGREHYNKGYESGLRGAAVSVGWLVERIGEADDND